MNLPFDEADVAPLPASFLARLQPAGAFLNPPNEETQSLRSPTALDQRQAPEMAPLKRQLSQPFKSHAAADGAVAMSFMSAMRRGLEGLQSASDSEDEEDDDDDEEGGYYQPAYNQYHAPTASFTGRASTIPTTIAVDDELIFPMEM